MKAFVISIANAESELTRLGGSVDRCFFLHDDFTVLNQLRKKGFMIETLGETFHETLRERTEEILAIYEALIRREDPDRVWNSQLTSRNVALDPAVKNLCFVECARRLGSEAKGNVAFIVQSPAVGETLARSFGCDDVSLWGAKRKSSNLRWLCKSMARAAFFLGTSLLTWFKTRGVARELRERLQANAKAPKVLFRSWVTRGCLSQDAKNRTVYRDRNFGELLDFVKSEGRDAVVMPMLFNLGESEAAFLGKLKHVAIPFVVPEAWLGPLDYIRAFARGMDTLRLDTDGAQLNGVDVSAILREAHLSRACGPEFLRLNLCEDLLRILAAEGVRFERILYPFENNPVEKVFLRAARRFHAGTPVSGFQHSMWYREQLAMELREGESSLHPLPDEILCSGTVYLGVLKKMGFPERLLKLGANLRFPEVLSIQPRERKISLTPSVLVILNFSESHSRELLGQLVAGWTAVKSAHADAKVRIKIHPLLDKRGLESFLRDLDFGDYEWESGSVGECVSRAAAVIMVGGSVSNLEVLVSAVPLIRWSLASDFNLDCVWDGKESDEFVGTPEDLARAIKIAFTLGDDQARSLVARSHEIKARYFEPVSDSKLKAFMA